MNYKSQAMKVIQAVTDRVGYPCCEMCGRSEGNLHCHHLVYRSERPKSQHLHDTRNLILLCAPCHKYMHDKKDRRSQLVKERKLKKLFAI